MFDFDISFFKKLFASLDNNAVLMRVEDDGSYYPIWCSREFTQMMEGTQEDFMRLESGGSMHTVHPDDREAVAYLFKNHRTKDDTNILTIRKRTVKGNELWVNVHYAFVKEDSAQYAYCTYTDVTEMKQSQQQTLAMYNELNKELDALSSESLAALRSNVTKGVVEEVHGTDLYDIDKPGAPIEDLMTVRLANMPVASDRETYMKVFDLERLKEKYYLGEGPTSLVIFSKRQSGRQCFIKYSAAMRKDPTTGDVIVLGVETEYNAQKVTEVLDEKVLAKQYDMVCYIVDENYGVAIGDAANIERGSIFPKERDGIYQEYLDTQVIPVVQEQNRQATLQALSLDTIARELEHQESYTVDVDCLIDGEIYNKRFTFYTVDRETKFYILLKSDITDLIREERERNELLASALYEAEKANAAKTSFLSSMSHEIRTPMNAIIGLSNIALSNPELPPQTREQLEKIDGSAKHLLSLINDILDMSRIESGRMTLKNEEFSFRETLDQINTIINSQCNDKGLTYECRINGPVDDYFIGDDMKLKQVVINILGNSVKFTPEGGAVTFEVEPLARFDGKVTMRFVMRDTGIGMDADYLPRIFEAFSQEDESKANKYGSTGLGMAITKNIVEMMNGTISVESEKNVGSTFTVIITLKQSDKMKHDVNTVRPQDLRVLVIDDDPIACEHAKLVLDEVGISSDTCLSGAEALETLRLAHARREPYSLILVDLKMPEQNGVEVTRSIRKLYDGESTIIILTAYSWDDVIDDAIEAGVDGFMAKPLFASAVLEEFKKAIARKGINEEEPHRANLNGKRVLLAEDVPINAEIMQELLGMEGMIVDHAENGQIAVDMFADGEEGYYDAVLMDVRMPVLDGLSATAAIRALERCDAKKTPIIAMTANAFDEDVQRSLQYGMDAHLSKPVDPKQLFETLKILIKD